MTPARLLLLLALTAPLPACGAGSNDPGPPPPPPWALPSFDGQTTGRDKPPAEPYERPVRPEAQTLFDLALTCYPTPSWYQPEIALQAGVTQRRTSADTNAAPVTLEAAQGSYIGVIARLPLYSSAEIDRERQRELDRRQAVAAAVADFEGAITERSNAQREIAIQRAIEARSSKRVAIGVAETAEQLAALKAVSELESRISKANAAISRARLVLIGMCKDRGDVTQYLDRWAK